MPLAYPTGTIAEHRACREGSVAFDVSHLGTVRVVGPDAFEHLQRSLTNDLRRVHPGRAQYTHLLDEDGSVVDDLIVWWVDEERFDVMPNASNTSAVVDAIGGHDVTAGRAVVAVQGPEARARLAAVSPAAAEVHRFCVDRFEWDGATCLVAGTATPGRTGWNAPSRRRSRRPSGRPSWRRASSRRDWARATPFAWKPAYPCTGTSSARASRRCRPGSAGWWAGTRGTSPGGPPSRRNG